VNLHVPPDDPAQPPRGVYEVGGHRLAITSPRFAEAIAAAYVTQWHGAQAPRFRCLCRPEGVEMYVARLGEGFIVKRMPNTGSEHAPDCASYEPPAELSGLGQVLGTAINEDPVSGTTTLTLGFPMSRMPGRSMPPSAGSASDQVVSDSTRLSLRGLLHYLWDQAELTRWHPVFSGKRSWFTVHRHLMRAAQNKIACGAPLSERLYVPEPFAVEHREAIQARRLAKWAGCAAKFNQPQPLMLIIAEVKEIVPARFGHKVVIKHMPDQALAIDESLYRRMGRVFKDELMLWGNSDSLRMVMGGLFGINTAGVPTIDELSLMLVTPQWLPIDDAFDLQLIERLLQERRSFVKVMRFSST
jgi:hypothetical protein